MSGVGKSSISERGAKAARLRVPGALEDEVVQFWPAADPDIGHSSYILAVHSPGGSTAGPVQE